MRVLPAAALVCSAAFAFRSCAEGRESRRRLHRALEDPGSELRTCTIDGDKRSRVWCPNGAAFDLDDAQAPAPLAQSLCQLTRGAD